MENNTITILWVGSVIVAAGLGYEGAKTPAKVIEKVVYKEGKVVYQDRVITKFREFSPSGTIAKETVIIDNKKTITTEKERISDKLVDNSKNWAVSLDYGLNNYISGAVERRILGPISIRGGVSMRFTPIIGDITPFVGIKFEF